MNNMSSINAISVRKIRIVQDILFSPMEGREQKRWMDKERRKRKEPKIKSHAQENGFGGEEKN